MIYQELDISRHRANDGMNIWELQQYLVIHVYTIFPKYLICEAEQIVILHMGETQRRETFEELKTNKNFKWLTPIIYSFVWVIVYMYMIGKGNDLANHWVTFNRHQKKYAPRVHIYVCIKHSQLIMNNHKDTSDNLLGAAYCKVSVYIIL